MKISLVDGHDKCLTCLDYKKSWDWCCCTSMVCHVNQLLPVFVSSCYGPRYEWNESSVSVSSSVAVPCVHFIFLCCHMAVWANIQFCFKLRQTAAEVYEILRIVYWNETLSHMHCMSSNDLEDAEWNVRTLKMIQEVSSCQLLKIWK